MAEQKNQFITMDYQLYVEGENGLELMEETKEGQPFQFITGLGIALDAFERQVINLEKDNTFEFSIPKEQAYGDYNDELLLTLDREIFCINGHFDHEHIYEDAVVPLQDEEGRRFYGRIIEVGEEKVKVDLNNPLAGETLHFKGKMLENRPATMKEIEHMAKHLAGGCSGHCDDCGGGCGDDCSCDHEHEHGGGCGCGHCH